MKLSDIRPSVESSGTFEEQMFSIQDTGMIFDILRNKMYSNPISAICREISCNARDAHREVGKADVPVHIQLPNTLEPFYKIKDFGPGISPDRMANIFIRYTASTKRTDNLQTGGFGLGAKTPFSYSDAFVIVTVHNGIKYNYSAVIDETKVGKMALMSSEPTEEPNGTEIIIPVKPQDFRNFRDSTEIACRHWTVKPIVTGADGFAFNEMQTMVAGNNWALVKSSDWNHEVKLIIDGIEYPCDLHAMKRYSQAARITDSVYGNIYLYFGVGELSLSANRESVYLDDATKKKIADMFEVVKTELKSNIVSKVDQFDNLWDANVFYTDEVRRFFRDHNVVGSLSWKGCELSNSYKSIDNQVFSFSKGKTSRRYGNQPDKISRNLGREIHFRPNTVLVMNDLKLQDITVRHVKDLFKDGVKYVEVVHPGDKVIDDIIKAHHLDKMGLTNLSTVTTAKVRKYNPGTSRMTVFKFVGNSFTQTNYKDATEAGGRKIICKLSKDSYGNNRRVIMSNGKTVDTMVIEEMGKLDKTLSFYGVDSSIDDARIEEDFEDFEPFQDLVESLLDVKKEDYVGIKYACNEMNYPFHLKLDTRKMSDKSVFRTTIENLNKFKALEQKKSLVYIYEIVNGYITDDQLSAWVKSNPDADVERATKTIDTKYPLLSHIDRYGYHNRSIDHKLIDYVNLIDSLEGNKS